MDPELKTEEQEKLLSKVKKIISETEGKTASVKEWGKRELAYRVSKRNSGFFVEFDFASSSSSAPLILKKLQTEEQILRYLLVVGERRPA